MFCKYCGNRLKPKNGCCTICGHEMDRLEGCRQVVETTQAVDRRVKENIEGNNVNDSFEEDTKAAWVHPSVDDRETLDNKDNPDNKRKQWMFYGKLGLALMGAILIGFLAGYIINNRMQSHKKKDTDVTIEVTIEETTTKFERSTPAETTVEEETREENTTTEEKETTEKDTTKEEKETTEKDTTKEEEETIEKDTTTEERETTEQEKTAEEDGTVEEENTTAENDATDAE